MLNLRNDDWNTLGNLAPFKDVFGSKFEKLVKDGLSSVGRWSKDSETTTIGEVKAGKGCLTRKDGKKLSIPLNNPMAQLLRFGAQLQDVNRKAMFGGTFQNGKENIDIYGVQAGVPINLTVWAEKYIADKAEVPTQEADVAPLVASTKV